MSNLQACNEPAGEPYSAVAAALAGPGWGVFPGFLPRERTRELAQECRTFFEAGKFRHAGIGSGPGFRLKPEVRNDRVLWLDENLPTPAQKEWLNILETLRLVINRELYLGLREFEGHFAVYPPGSYYKRHLDQFKGIGLRMVTAILYLNDNWQDGDGGQLGLFLEEGAESPYLDVQPDAGTLVTFLSGSFLHEVLPARRERMSLAGWYRLHG